MGHQQAAAAGFEEHTASQRRIALSRVAQIGTRGLDQSGMEAERKQSTREVLFTDSARQAATGERDQQLGAALFRDLPHSAN